MVYENPIRMPADRISSYFIPDDPDINQPTTSLGCFLPADLPGERPS